MKLAYNNMVIKTSYNVYYKTESGHGYAVFNTESEAEAFALRIEQCGAYDVVIK